MPYKNITFVKLMVEMAKDIKFTDKCNDRQKLLYFCLLLLAGYVDNRIPHSGNWIKRTLNLETNPELIEQDLIHLQKVYHKLVSDKEFLSFENFKDIHNFKIGFPIMPIEKSKSKSRVRIRVREREEIEKERIYQPHNTKNLVKTTAKKMSLGVK